MSNSVGSLSSTCLYFQVSPFKSPALTFERTRERIFCLNKVQARVRAKCVVKSWEAARLIPRIKWFMSAACHPALLRGNNSRLILTIVKPAHWLSVVTFTLCYVRVTPATDIYRRCKKKLASYPRERKRVSRGWEGGFACNVKSLFLSWLFN